MTRPNLSLMNFRHYKHEPRIARPLGLITNSRILVKMYEMRKIYGNPLSDKLRDRYNEPLSTKLIDDSRDFIKETCKRGGLGLAILSEDTLNVAFWSNDTPIALVNSFYQHTTKQNIRNFEEIDVKKLGAFCIWEQGIVSYEREALMRFLKSKRTREDKLKYLTDYIEGRLD